MIPLYWLQDIEGTVVNLAACWEIRVRRDRDVNGIEFFKVEASAGQRTWVLAFFPIESGALSYYKQLQEALVDHTIHYRGH